MKTATNKPVFSVVIPVYNVERYIEECLTSVIRQTYTNFEIICVDDGSPDNSVALINSVNDPRIRVIRQKNRGLAAARNSGINASRGMYVALLDSDDRWHPEKLEQHFKHLSRNPGIGVSYSASQFIDENGRDMGFGQHPKLNNIDAVDIFCRNPVGNGSAPVLRKALLRAISRPVAISATETRVEYFDERMRQSEDVDFWLRIALTTQYKFEGIGKVLTFYRVNSSGLSANLDNQFRAWMYSIDKNRSLNPAFFKQWFSLGCAFQKLYLARRAIKSGQGITAFKLVHQALKLDIRILTREPKKTFVTYGCAYLAMLPHAWFDTIFNFATGLKNQRS